MKLKLYLRMVVALMVAMFTATGCSSSNEEPVGPVEDPLTFQLEVSDIGTGEATVAVKPNKETPTYYCGAMEKSVYDAFASEAEFLAADLKRLQNLATQNKMTLKAYLETNTSRGEGNRTVVTSAAKTAHYAYVYGIKIDGTVTSKVYIVEFTSGDVPVGPVVDLQMWPGDSEGANKSVMLSFSVAVTESPAVSCKYYFNSTEEIEKALAAGETYESLAASSEYEFEGEMITEMNSPAGLTGYGFGSVEEPLPADTSCTLIVLVTDANGVVSVEHIEAKTDPSSGGDLKLTINVSNITASTAHVAVTASNETPYFFASIDDESYQEAGGTPATVVPALLQGLWEYAQQAYPNLSLPEILDILASRGNATFDEKGLDPNTLYHEFAVPIDMTTGAPTAIATMKEFTTTNGGGGDGPTVTVTVAPGAYPSGGDPTTQMHLIIESDPMNVTAGKYYFKETSAVEEALASGLTYESLVNDYGSALDATRIGYINDGGLVLTLKAGTCKPNTSYTVIASLTNPSGTSVEHGAASTEGGGGDTPSDAYKAWLGTWTVTSTSSEVNKKALSFDVTFAQNVVNASYKVSGWGITAIRTNDTALPVATLAADGTFAFAAGQQVATTENGPVQFTARIQYSDKNFYGVTPEAGTTFLGLAGTMNADKVSAKVVGGQVEIDNTGTKYTIHGLDMFVNRTDGKLGYFNTDPQFTTDDYPMGPYTMTKKSGASAPARSMSVNSALRSSLAIDKGVAVKSAVGASDMMLMSSFLKASNMKADAFVKPEFKAYMKELNFSKPASGKRGLNSIPATLNK